MPNWSFYATTGYVGKGSRFDPNQIEERLEIGLNPSLLLKPEQSNPKIVGNLCNYLREKSMSGSPVEMSAHISYAIETKETEQISESREIEKCIDFAYQINRKLVKMGLEESMIREVDVHAGSLHDFNTEFRIRSEAIKKGRRYRNLAVTFNDREYWEGLKKAEERLNAIGNFGKKRGIEILVENVNFVNFATKELYDVLKNDYSLEDYVRGDLRHGPTNWIPDLVNRGDYGCYRDLLQIHSGAFVMDVEHVSQMSDYSRDYNFEVCGNKKPKTEAQRRILEKCGVWIERGKEMVFERPVDTSLFIEELGERVRQCHIVGQVYATYWDSGVKKIGSHMPLLFEGDSDPLGIFEDREIKDNMARKIEKKMKKDVSALKKTGCEKAVFEIFLGPGIYSGQTWKYYNYNSLKNLISVYSSV